MSSISDIVDVEITRDTTSVSQAGFGTVLVLGAHKVFNERVRFYLSSDSILEDGFTVQDPEYIAANAAFSQTPRPVQVAIGRRSADVVNLEVTSVVALTDYKITINGTDFVYQAQVGETAADIAAELVDLINAGSEPVTAADLTAGVLSLTANEPGVAYTVKSSARISLQKPIVASDDITNDLIAVSQENDDWYGLVITSRSPADVIEAATYIESRIKIFGTASDDEDILDASSINDIAYILKEGNFKRTFLLYHNLAGQAYPEAAWFGRMFPTAPGSATWAFKTLEGIPVVKMTLTQRTNVFNKNANTYELRGGAAITREGKMSGNEWIDVIRGLDWLEARMTERIFFRLVNTPIIPYTDAGVAAIEAEIRAQLDAAIDQGVIAQDPAYVVTSPRVRDVNPNDKANRILPDINFTATLAGAIHSVTVRGRVSV